MKFAVLSLVLLAACRGDDGTVARMGDARWSAVDIERAVSANPEDKKAFARDPRRKVVELVMDEALFQKGRALNVATGERAQVIAAMRAKLTAEEKTKFTPEEISDAELMPFYSGDPRTQALPARVAVVATLWPDARSAASFAARARAATHTAVNKEADFRKSFNESVAQKSAPSAVTIDFDVTRAPEWAWPKQLVEPCFSAREGDVVGPIAGASARTNGEKHFVLYVAHVLGEKDTFAQARPMLRERVYDILVTKRAVAAAMAMTETMVSIDEGALARLTQRMTPSTDKKN